MMKHLLFTLFITTIIHAAPLKQTILYSTGFELSEGYPHASLGQPLRNVMGWKGSGSGGNGFVEEYFKGLGQQAYIGFSPPAPKDGFLIIWKELDLPFPTETTPIWRFSVWTMIVDSTNGQYDEFRWTIYNKKGEALLCLGFDNYTLDIYFGLDNGIFHNSGYVFENDIPYFIEIWLNFSRNLWQARINGVVVVNAEPITTQSREISLGDIDAVWVTSNPNRPGDNFMVFDEYCISIEPYDIIPSVLETIGLDEQGYFQFIVYGEPSLAYTIQTSTDFINWTIIETGLLNEKGKVFIRDQISSKRQQFYRCVQNYP